MKNKTLLYHVVLFLVFTNANILHSQNISINLSIRWSEGPHILKTDSIVKHPELVVSYTNNSAENLYFRKFSYYRDGIPDFLWGAMETVAFDPEMLEIGETEYKKIHRDYIGHIEKAIGNKPYKNDLKVI